jgi:hypothetical protein
MSPDLRPLSPNGFIEWSNFTDYAAHASMKHETKLMLLLQTVITAGRYWGASNSTVVRGFLLRVSYREDLPRNGTNVQVELPFSDRGK